MKRLIPIILALLVVFISPVAVFGVELKDAQEKVRLYPNYAEAHYNLGLAYADLDLHFIAISSYKEAIRIKPDYAHVHYDLGVTYEKVEQYQAAIVSYKEALRLYPFFEIARNNLNRLKQNLADIGLKNQTNNPFLNAIEADRLDRERKLLVEEKRKLEVLQLNTDHSSSGCSHQIEVNKNDDFFLINGEKFEAKSYCLGFEEGDMVRFLEESPLGACASAKILNCSNNKTCEVWCE
jgi:tetratricopeptide (TPR) repeat protein